VLGHLPRLGRVALAVVVGWAVVVSRVMLLVLFL